MPALAVLLLLPPAFKEEAGLRKPLHAIHQLRHPPVPDQAVSSTRGDVHPGGPGVGSKDTLLSFEDVPFEHGADLGKDFGEHGLAQRQYGNLFEEGPTLADVKLLLQRLGNQPIVEANGRYLVQPVVHEPWPFRLWSGLSVLAAL